MPTVKEKTCSVETSHAHVDLPTLREMDSVAQVRVTLKNTSTIEQKRMYVFQFQILVSLNPATQMLPVRGKDC